MTPEKRLERILPGVEPEGDGVERPWVIILSEWATDGSLGGQTGDLVARIYRLFDSGASGGPPRLLLVVDDMSRQGWSEPRRRLLRSLAEMGAFVLEPDGETEVQVAANDPLGFAHQQLVAAMAAGAQSGIAPTPGSVSAPDGYRELGKAVTRLSPQELADLIEGRRRDDQWRYDW